MSLLSTPDQVLDPTTSTSSFGRGDAALADALLTRTQQRVLAVLFGQPNRSFYVNEIIRLARSGRGAVLRELSRLARSRLINARKIGNQKHFRANRNSPIFEELCGLIRKTVALDGPLREALVPLKTELDLALLYGSVAKRSDTAASDIDIMLVSDKLAPGEAYAVLHPLEHDLGRRINPVLYTRDEFCKRASVDDSFVKRVLSGPTTLLLGSVDAALGT